MPSETSLWLKMCAGAAALTLVAGLAFYFGSLSSWTAASQSQTLFVRARGDDDDLDTDNAPPHTGFSTQNADLYPPPSRLGKLPNFEFIHNEEICKNKPVFLVILVDSAPIKVDHRVAIRNSYAMLRIKGYHIVTLFVLGQVSSELQGSIKQEIDSFHDIIQGNFLDHYRNQTYTDLMGIRWVNTYCPQAKYILKTDDDVFLDLHQLADVMDNTYGDRKEFMACMVVRTDSPVVRDPGHPKWYMSKEEFPNDVYDPYCIFSAFLFTPALGKKMDELALSVHEGISINDIYLTGVLMRHLSISLSTLEQYYASDAGYWEGWVKSSPTAPSRYIFAPFPGGSTQLAREVSLKLGQIAAQYFIPHGRHHG